MSTYMWGDEDTQYFYELGPDKILEAIEDLGYETTGRCLTCNSMENRVYDVEIIVDEDKISSPSDAFRIIKFYRPGRWTQEQILEEHTFLADLAEEEIPVIEPIAHDGKTLFKMHDSNIYYAVFPKRGGRVPDEMDFEQLERMGRLLARLHATGRARQARHRIRLTPETYGRQNLEYLLLSQSIPSYLESQYQQLVENICKLSTPLFDKTPVQRIHGDCHIGNILWGASGLQLFDFDDMVVGPPVQDIWLVIPGRDDDALRQRNILLDAYKTMSDFDDRSLRLIEPLRALRFIHFSAWIAKRYQDPAFTRAFPDFGTPVYWETQIHDLRDQLALIQEEL